MVTSMTRQQVLQRRLAVQRLAGPGLSSATDVVRLLTCVQSQEHAHALWSLGMRTAGLDEDQVRREFDEGRFVRTHILRPTWHFVAAEDLRWVLAVTSPRVQQINRTQYRQLGLSQDDLDRSSAVLVETLGRGEPLTRTELGTALAESGLAAQGQRLAYVVMNAELEGALCSGPMRGAQHTYVLVGGSVPTVPALGDDQALAALTWRFFAGHGPAGLKDFTRWSSLTQSSARAGLELVGDRLERLDVGEHRLWHDPAAQVADGPAQEPLALLVPLYDELTLSYPQLNVEIAPGHPHPPDADLFIGSVLVDLQNVGTWRRTVRGSKVLVETSLVAGLGTAARTAVAQAVARLAAFLGRELEQRAPDSRA